MRLSTIAWANLKRRKGKAIFLIIGMAIGLGTVVALIQLTGSIRDEIGTQLDRFGANIVVVPRTQSLALDYGGVSVSGVAYDVQQLKNEDTAKVMEIPYRSRLAVVAPKLLGAVEISGRPILLAGVDFASELKLKRWWRIVGHEPKGEADLLLGYDAAQALGLIEPVAGASMQKVSLPVQHHETDPTEKFKLRRDELEIAGRKHHISGVIAPTGAREDGMIFGSLAHVQTLLKKPEQLSLIEVSALCKDCPVEDIVAQISMQLPHAKVSAIQQAARARSETVERLTRFSAAIAVIVLSIGALMILTTMMGAVVERTREIGVMRAIGFRKSHIIKELILEVTVISLCGGLLGWGLGMLASWLALPYFSETETQVPLQPELLISALVAALVIGILSSLYPAIRASRLDPAEAVRYV